MLKIVMALAVTTVMTAPSFAQTQTPTGQTKAVAECETNFKSADKDANGTLSKAEMTAAPKVIPTGLSSQESITKQQFMSACQGTTPKGG